jgi:exodeoxyribonuclease V beta subunit
MVGRVLTAPLEEGRGDFLLSGVEDRLSELEFYFPLSKIAPQGLADVFARHQAPDMLKRPAAGGFAEGLRRLEFTPLRGFVRGFIDLVFRFQGRYYIIDWKSNRLGDSPRDYGEPRLREEMLERSYVLQYHLYAAALHRHLAARLPGYDYGKHFGGVFYLFVRGVDPALGPGFGVFRDRPAPELMEDLSRYLAGGDGAGVI